MTDSSEKSLRAGWVAAALLLAVVVAAIYAAAIVLGDLNQDEGWYLYAGRMVHEGKLPFRDFAFTQGPVTACVHGLAWPLADALGVAGGRLFTALLGGLTVLLTACLAGRLAAGGGDRRSAGPAALLAAGLLGLNLYHVYFTSLVKTYGPSGLMTVLGFTGLERALRAAARREGRAAAFWFGAVAAGCFALAAGMRLSAGVLLPAAWLPLAFLWRRGRHQGLPAVLAGMLAGGCATLAAVYLPFLLTVPKAVSFGLLEYHAGRQVGGVATLLAYKAGFLLRLSASYFPLLALGAIGLANWRRAGAQNDSPAPGMTAALAGGMAAVTAVHLAAPFPYDDYQVFVMPCAALLAAPPAAALLMRLPLGEARRKAIMAGALALMLLHSASSPMLQSWVTAGRDRIWWPLRKETPLQGLRRAAQIVRHAGGDEPGGLLLTQDTYLAVEAGMRVPPGMEPGPFCFFPDLDDGQAARQHVLNEAMLTALINDGEAAVAAFSEYGLAISAPGITPVEEDMARRLEEALLRRYEPVARIENFGQGQTTLRILRRRATP